MSILVYHSKSNRGWETNGIYGLGILLTEFLPIDNNFKYLKIDVVMMLYCIIHIAFRLLIQKKSCTTFTPFFIPGLIIYVLLLTVLL